MNLFYLANIRLPTEKAHGLQIVQNCEAFAANGVQVSLWTARRVNTPELRAVTDIWAHYGVQRNFALRRLPCLDLLPFVPGRVDRLAQILFLIQLITFTLSAVVAALFTRADVYYSRDPLVLLALGLFKPRRKLAYEAHALAGGRGGRWMQRLVARRVGHIFATTLRLADDLITLGADPSGTHVAHDGVRRERCEGIPDRDGARELIGWQKDSFIVGYVGRLQTMAMDKGVGLLVEALAKVDGASITLVGGPDDMAEGFKRHWIELGQDERRFLYAGQVAPERVPVYLSAFDVCAMPFPFTTHFAYHASPIKLFEYMASRRAVVASDLPSIREVVTDGESALLVPPGDVDALAAAITRLRDDPSLRERLANNAYALVMERYTWDARARAILDAIRRA